ncbi:PilZ domain-containing protein [Acidobacteria bacterium AH-259-D05]|nr:PilZ domain-containing protein [Acidobacteria bacterium AH-259-D05]
MNKEKRKGTRLEVRLEGKGTVYTEGKESQIEVIARNISALGAYCVTDADVNMGDEVKLLLQWASVDRQSEIVFKAVGRIVRVEPQPEKGYGFGIRFDEIPVVKGD